MNLPERKPNRLKEYDYSSNGAYFVTICTQDRKELLSRIVGDGLSVPQLTQEGQIVNRYIDEISARYVGVRVDKYVIMPNHIHLLISIQNQNGTDDPSPTIGTIIGWFKYNVTKEINGCRNCIDKIFQRSFHDHIIRNEQDYKEIWEYIDMNPLKWEEDCFYCRYVCKNAHSI